MRVARSGAYANAATHAGPTLSISFSFSLFLSVSFFPLVPATSRLLIESVKIETSA